MSFWGEEVGGCEGGGEETVAGCGEEGGEGGERREVCGGGGEDGG